MFDFLIRLIDAIVWPLLFVVCIWLCFFINMGYDLGWNFYGLRPGYLQGLLGIISMPFLHGNFEHLFSNTVPLVLSLAFIFMYFPNRKWHIMFIIWIASGTLLWLIAKTGSNHIGASGLVYGYIAFLITHAFISRNKESIAASFVLIFLYGGIVYGLFPEYGRLIGKNISWEGHLSGALMGIALAFIYRKYGPRKKLYFEDEDEDEEDDNFPEEDWLGNEDLKIRYIYRKDANEEQS